MNRYAVAGALIVVIAVVVVVVGAFVVSARTKRRRVAARDLAWANAQRNAVWREEVQADNEEVVVVVQRIAVMNGASTVLTQRDLERIPFNHENFQVQLDAAWANARDVAFQLNNGPL